MINDLMLGSLSDPSKYVEHLDLKNESTLTCINFLSEMFKIRIAEEKIAELVEKGYVKCPCHLVIGQEAVPVGISKYLKKSDRVFAHIEAMGTI